MSEVEKGFSPCEREVLALVWSINHWEYLVGMSPIVLRTLHTPVSYVLSRRINEGRVSNPQLVNWPLSLLNKDVQVEKAQFSSTILYSLFTSGEDHKCPLSSEDTNESKSPFLSKTAYKAAKKTQQGYLGGDGSYNFHESRPWAGYASLQIRTGRTLQGTVMQNST